MIIRPIAWQVRWLSRPSPSPYPCAREFADKAAAERFLRLVETVFAPDDLAVALLEPWTNFFPGERENC
jgi:hypothetical protein